MPVKLDIPANPEPIITGWGFAYAIENAAGEILLATTVIAASEAKNGGLTITEEDGSNCDIAQSMADSILKFADCMDGEAARVRYMSPSEYADWCAENCDDEGEIEEDDDFDCED